MKAKQTPIAAAINPSPLSLKDAGYQTARVGEGRAAIAQYVLEQCPSFPDDVSAEAKAELFAGFQLRAYELWGTETYRLGDTGVLLKDPAGNVSVDVNVAMAYTGQAFGRLKEENPALHGVISTWRQRFQKYSSNCMGDLKEACRRIQNAGQSKTRSSNKGFVDAMNAAFDALDKRVKTAQARGDTDANPVQYRIARDAFWKAYNS